MPRQVLPLIDLRSQAERQGITRTQQTAQAIANILQTIGAAEEKRRERQTLDRVTRAIAGGATTIEAISAIGQEPEFSTGIPGALQRFGGMFQPSPGGMGQGIQQAIIGGKLQQELAKPSPLRTISTGEVTSIFDPTTGQIVPTEHPSARVPTTTIHTGPELLTPEQRQEGAETAHLRQTELTITARTKAVDSIKDILWEISPAEKDQDWFDADFSKKTLLDAYKQYRIQNNYAGSTEKQIKRLDAIWDSQIMNWSKHGYLNRGKGEFDWDPNNPEIKALRGEKRKSPYKQYPGAFLEDGVWKVIRNGRKYRVED